MVLGNADTQSRWNEIDRLFHAALAVEPAVRETFLRERCEGDEALQNEVLRLLRLHFADDSFLQTEVPEMPGDHKPPAVVAEDRRVGAFQLVRQIGEGGMATVWFAKRAEATFQQRVALKVMRWGPVSANWRHRFESERQALAQLEHPYITRLIDGGTAERQGDYLDGLPYLVMEFVEGEPISRYCDTNRLGVQERLTLFCKVCEAVHYAHQNLIVHRDLKPGNILVTADGQPKLLDFGIAKLLAPDAPVSEAATETLLRALTPRYASPEQVRGETITTASDIYSLGVMLYELLTGRRAYPDPGSSRYERERMVCEVEPTSPSLVVESAHAPPIAFTDPDTTPTADELAAMRGESGPSLRRRLRGDLDNIILMALQKNPARRYSTVQQFREDINRYLAGMPVIARKDTAGYRFAKFARRHRPAVIGAAAVAAAVAFGIMGTLMGLRQARAERDVANRVSAFMQDVLLSANPYRASARPYRSGGETNVLDLLADASRRVNKELREQPEAAAATRYAIAEVYGGLWRWSDVEPQVRIALDDYRRCYPDDHPAVAKCLALLGRALTFRACEESIAIQREGLAIRLKHYGEDHPLVAESKVCLAFAYWLASDEPRWTAAEKLYREGLQTYRDTKHTQNRDYAQALYSLAAMYLAKGDVDAETESLLAESLDVYRAFPYQEDRYMSECLRAFADLHRRRGRQREEAAALEESIAITPELFLSDDRVRGSIWRRVELAARAKNISDFQRCLHRAIKSECERRKAFPHIHGESWAALTARLPRVQSVGDLLASIENQLDQLPMQACPWNQDLAERLVSIVPFVAEDIDSEGGHRLARKCLDYQLTRYPYRKLAIAYARVQYGRSLIADDRLEEAEEQLLSGYKTIHPQVRSSDYRHIAVVHALIRLYEAMGNLEKAAVYYPKLPSGPLE